MGAIAELEVPGRVTGVLAACENMVGPDAIRPSDVIETAAGLTVEVTNPDAEGRLILADALWYTRRLGTTQLIDLATRRTQVVPDVHAFPGHIACDAASRSEIVVPMYTPDGALIGVWDVDSPVPARFDDDDRAGMEALVRVFLETLRAAGA
jgi:hypothetical protein